MISAVAAGLLLGWIFFGGDSSSEETAHEHGSAEMVWTCSMHPDIRRTEPGDCPICGMDLIPMANEENLNSDIFQMSEDAMKLANIRTLSVGTDAASKEMRLNGKVAVDERNSYSQSTHIPGRIERLNVNYTGEEVQRGQTLGVVYSPELVTAQEELLQAYRIREQQPQLYAAVRAKLGNWRISENLMDRIVASGKPLQSFPITADVSGVVTEKFVELGDYVERGMPLYTVADLSEVWVLFDIYESQMAYVKEGSKIEFSVASLPGETFEGEISFVDPLLNSATRVATARVEVENSQGKLKPEMFASGVVKSELGEIDSEEIIIPKSAVLWTGKRSLVYIKEDLGNTVGFRLREVVLGPSLGDSYVIEEGLEKGEEIVVNGTFTVDAAVQLSGKPSMMNPEGASTGAAAGQVDLQTFLDSNSLDLRKETSAEFKQELGNLLKTYLQLKEALVESSLAQSTSLSNRFTEELENITANELSGEALEFWNARNSALTTASRGIGAAEDLERQREHFTKLSEEMIKTLVVFGLNNQSIFVDHCPMANSDEGAYWLSDIRNIRNPYFGEAMLSCGEIVKEIN